MTICVQSISIGMCRGPTIAKKSACILDVCNIVGVAEAAVTAELFCWIRAALFDGLGFAPPVCLLS